MTYTKQQVIDTVRDYLSKVNRDMGGEDKLTDNDYRYIGLIASALKD